jgi:hypothetical protein
MPSIRGVRLCSQVTVESEHGVSSVADEVGSRGVQGWMLSRKRRTYSSEELRILASCAAHHLGGICIRFLLCPVGRSQACGSFCTGTVHFADSSRQLLRLFVFGYVKRGVRLFWSLAP